MPALLFAGFNLLLLVGGGVWWFLRRRRGADEGESLDLDELVGADDAAAADDQGEDKAA
jgi:hypothetical protein